MEALQCTPEVVIQSAEQYDVDPGSDFWLLPIIGEAVVRGRARNGSHVAPLGGESLGAGNTTHGAAAASTSARDAGLANLIERYKAKGAPADNAARSVMRFEAPSEDDGEMETFAFDFATRSRVVGDVLEAFLIAAVPLEDLVAARVEQANDMMRRRRDRGGSCVAIAPSQKPPRPLAGSAPASAGRGTTEHLDFFCRWFEDYESTDLTFRDNGVYVGGGVRARHATLRYNLATLQFDVVLKARTCCESDVHLTAVSGVTTRAHMPVQPWDLHVGAALHVLGNCLTLRSCTAATGEWLDRLGRSVLALKAEALAELAKYSTDGLPPALGKARGTGCGRFQDSYSPVIEQQRQGGVHVQMVADQVSRVADLLSHFRPKLAERFRARLAALAQRSAASGVRRAGAVAVHAAEPLVPQRGDAQAEPATLAHGGMPPADQPRTSMVQLQSNEAAFACIRGAA